MKTPNSTGSQRRRIDYRGLITYLVMLSFFVMLISGIVMFFAPSGMVARKIGWALMGLGRAEWQTLHLSFAVVFVASGLSHLVCNWRGLLHHLRDRASRRLTLKWEAVLVLVATIWLVASAMLMLPPANLLHDVNEYFRKTFWANAVPANGTTTIPFAVEATGEDSVKANPVLPEGHPPLRAGEACRDCHR